MPDSTNAVFPMATVQTCIIHLIRGTFRYASRRYWDELSEGLRLIYTAVNAAAAEQALAYLEEKWGKAYPAIPQLWRSSWEQFIPFTGSTCRAEMIRHRHQSGGLPAHDAADWHDVADGF